MRRGGEVLVMSGGAVATTGTGGAVLDVQPPVTTVPESNANNRMSLAGQIFVLMALGLTYLADMTLDEDANSTGHKNPKSEN